MVAINALRQEQLRLREQGCLMGIGIASFVDATGGGPTKLAASLGRKLGSHDVAVVRLHPTGKVTAMCGSHSHGQSQATTYAQIVAAQLGCDTGDVEVVFGDTDRIHFGPGTYGPRSVTLTGRQEKPRVGI